MWYDFLTVGMQINPQAEQIIPVVAGVLGALFQCFFGFKFLRFIVSFWGLLLFGFVGYSLTMAVYPVQSVVIGVCVAAGLFGAVIAFKFYKAGVFLQGFIAGVLAGMVAGVFMEWEPVLLFSFAAVVGILIGLLTVYLFKPMVILTSASSGGMAAGVVLAGLFGFDTNVGAFIGIIFTVLGVIFQMFGRKKKDKKEKSDKAVADPIDTEAELNEAVAETREDAAEEVVETGEEVAVTDEVVAEEVAETDEVVAEEAAETDEVVAETGFDEGEKS